MSDNKKELIAHMDRDAQALDLPTYTELLSALRSAVVEMGDNGRPNVKRELRLLLKKFD